MEVIEHVDNPISFLETCAELVKVCVVFSLFSHILKHVAQPGGHLFLSTINRTPLSYFLTILLAERVLRMVTPGTHTHSKYIKPTELIDFFKQYRSPLDPESPAVDCPHLPYPTRTEAEVRGVFYNPIRVVDSCASRLRCGFRMQLFVLR
jgi:polyprenyldihydroxybenzoate methyltransferase/3-demethylubiquinol 3-O-methyltransferase